MDGKALAARKKSHIAREVSQLAEVGVTVGLGTLIVGDDPGSHSYVAGKHRDCAEVGIKSIQRQLPSDATEQMLWGAISELNSDTSVSGFIVQLPLPSHLDSDAALAAVSPGKDADGLHPFNLGQMMLGAPGPRPCTPNAILSLLRHYQVDLVGSNVVIVGRGTTVGRPLGVLMSQREVDATVTICHSRTKDLASLTRQADVLVAALGSAGFITPSMVKPQACVIDVGLTRTETGLVGDVAPEVADVAGFLTPVPGGVGPMTRAMLLENVVALADSKFN